MKMRYRKVVLVDVEYDGWMSISWLIAAAFIASLDRLINYKFRITAGRKKRSL